MVVEEKKSFLLLPKDLNLKKLFSISGYLTTGCKICEKTISKLFCVFIYIWVYINVCCICTCAYINICIHTQTHTLVFGSMDSWGTSNKFTLSGYTNLSPCTELYSPPWGLTAGIYVFQEGWMQIQTLSHSALFPSNTNCLNITRRMFEW